MPHEKSESLVFFTNREDFNDFLSPVIDDSFEQFEKIRNYFSHTIKECGPDSFHATLVVFNRFKKIVSVVTSRPVEDKNDMYYAISQMLQLPVAVNSELFILAQDSRISILDKNGKQVEEKSDGLIITFVTPETCTIFTIPYSVDDDNVVDYKMDKAWIRQVTEGENYAAFGPMLEMLYIYSHLETPIVPVHEVFAFFKARGFAYDIISKENLEAKAVMLPIKV